MWFIPPKSCPNLPWYSMYALIRSFPVKWSATMIFLSYVESVQKGVANFLNFPVGNHSFTIPIMWSVWSILKPIGDWKIRKFWYLSTDNSWNLIPEASSKNFLSSGNSVSLLEVFRKPSVETVIKDEVPSYNTLI